MLLLKSLKLITILFTLTIIEGCSKPKEVTTPSGLKYIDLTEGTGASPSKDKKVVIHYIGTINGRIFDTTVDKRQPYEFVVGDGENIPGLEEGLLSMKVGGRRKLIIPPNLAWGAEGAGGVIPPNTTVIFEVELLEVK